MTDWDDTVKICVSDIAQEAREMYGEGANEIAGRELPEHEYRFELEYGTGGRATMHVDATADDVQAFLDRVRPAPCGHARWAETDRCTDLRCPRFVDKP